jgi:hypothetical protein
MLEMFLMIYLDIRSEVKMERRKMMLSYREGINAALLNNS